MEETLQRHSFTKENAVFPFCKGCGHHHYVKHLDEAFVSLQLDPKQVCIVSDIGCIGILDSLFAEPHTFHTTHGRSTAFATGIALADGILHDAKLKTVVVIGDGGATIGLLHLVNAALMNINVTVVLANNFLYGMTGGQHSQFSPLEFVTPTTPAGNIVPPMDICAIMKSCGATYIRQAAATDKNLGTIIADAIAHPGFAIVEVLELCTEWATPFNKIDGKMLNGSVHQADSGGAAERKDFSSLYKEKVLGAPKKGIDDTIIPHFTSTLNGTRRIVLAGTAGEKVQLASFLYMKSAIASGQSTVKSDAAYGQSLAYLRMGLTDHAAVSATKSQMERPRATELQVSILADRAVSAFQSKRYAETLLLLDQRARLADERTDLMVLRGYSYLAMRRYADAAQIFESLWHKLQGKLDEILVQLRIN